MTVDETLELARSYSVEVRLNTAGDGLELEVEADPPQALINILSRAKRDIVAALRQREIDRRRPLITAWINDHFTIHSGRRLPPLRRGRAGRRRLRPPLLRRR